MRWRYRVLLVAPTGDLARNLFAWLTEAGYDVCLVATFGDAKVHLQAGPDVLVSEVRLGEYNGLHLAARAGANAIPAVVIGDPDPVLVRDARQLGAAYVQSDGSREYLLALIRRLLGDTPPSGRSARSGWAAANLAFISSSELAPIKTRGRRLD